MTHTRIGFALCLATACATAACAATTATTATTTTVRDIDGKPLPSYALNDTATAPVKVDCNDGRSYMIVTDLPADLYAPSLTSTYRFQQPGVSSVCGRIAVLH
ncbi:MAG TPA: hypothetical protein VH165_00475 [Kofleriaceae bacterium]|nr:hypothetical protein [Kofleriaceae bacterium]